MRKCHKAFISLVWCVVTNCVLLFSAHAQTVARFGITTITPSENTGMNYTPWLTDNLDTLVKSVWNGANMKYVEVKIALQHRVLLDHLSLYDYEGVFTTNPAYLYAKAGSVKKLVGKFEGLTYKTFVNMNAADSATYADTIIVYKYGNNIPQKVQVYGTAYSGFVPGDTTVHLYHGMDTAGTVKIPFDISRWYTLTYAPKGLGQLFNGVTNESVSTGFASFQPAYQAIYPLDSGESIVLKKIKFYDMYGTFASHPMILSVINNAGEKIQVATFTGSTYQAWVGPYPDRSTSGEDKYWLDSAISGIRAIVLDCYNNNFPSEMELYGNYTAPLTVASNDAPHAVLANATGINGFEWDFVNAQVNYRKIDSLKYSAIKSFKLFRQYLDWSKIEEKKNINVFNRWPYDAIYKQCKQDSITVLVCLQNIPVWMQQTYPDSLRSNDNNPVPYGYDLNSPASGIDKAKAGFQFAARYGRNTNIPYSMITVDTLPRWTGDTPDTIKIGLGLVKYIECGNEPDKWWKGKKGYMNPYEYAAQLSAFYDGNMNTMGAGVGVKNADSSMMVVAAGIACADPSYYRAMIEWCRMHRGYKADGSVNICWDVINYHYYSNDASSSQNGNSTRGAAPEVSDAVTRAANFVAMSKKYAHNTPVWLTEVGYDSNQQSSLKAIAIGNKTVEETRADWVLRSSLVMSRTNIQKIFFYNLYDADPNNATKFSSSGFVDTSKHRKADANFLYQLQKRYGNYVYQQTLNTSPVADKYSFNEKTMYALWMPTEKDSSSSYDLQLGTDSALVATPVAGGDSMNIIHIATDNGTLHVTVTETPVFAEPFGNFVNSAEQTTGNVSMLTSLSRVTAANTQMKLKVGVYPNPCINALHVSVDNLPEQGLLHLAVFETGTGNLMLYKTYPYKGVALQQSIDISALQAGTYQLVVTAGGQSGSRIIIKQ